MQVFHSIFTYVCVLVVAWLISENRRGIRWQKIGYGSVLIVFTAFLVLKIAIIRDAISYLGRVVQVFEKVATEAASFMFGYLAGGPLPFHETSSGASFIVAFRVLPLVLVLSAFSSLLFYWGIIPWIIHFFSRVLRKTFKMSGISGFAAASDVFLGIAEGPVFLRPYLPFMSRHELFTLMTCGMSSLAGTLMVLYASVLKAVVPEAATHILIASIVTIPAAILVSYMIIPEEVGYRDCEPSAPREATSAFDAILKGTEAGVQIIVGIIASIIVLFAFVHLLNEILLNAPFMNEPPTLQKLFGYLFQPFLWVMGFPPSEHDTVRHLFGTKTVLNEFVAFLEMSKIPAGVLEPRSRVLLTYALCGCANFASVGILIGGLGSFIKERRNEITQLAFRALISANLAGFLSSAVIGLFV